jgi:acetyltransferase-like isoleucine patch superfamily enzyme
MSGFRRSSAVAYLGIRRWWWRARSKAFSTLSAGAFASFGRSSVIELPVRLEGEHRMAIGHGVFIGSGSWLSTLGDGDGVALEIGDGTGCGGHCVIAAAERVSLGRNVLMARNVYISDHGHAFEDLTRPVMQQGITHPRPVRIDDGAWLGENVVICPGVRIGAGAVVGANAVVLSDVPPHSVAVGVPARVVRTFGPTAETVATAPHA